MTAYIHVGLGKTGTTSIQRSLARCESLLIKQNILYIQTGRVDDGHHALFPLGKRVERSLISSLADEVSKNKSRDFLISSECAYYSRDSLSDVVSALGGKAKIIFYARPQNEAILSTYLHRQRMNLEYHGSLKNFVNNHWQSFDYWQKINDLCERAQDDSPIVRLFVPGKAKDGAVIDFFNIFDINGSNFISSDINKENISLHPCFSNIISFIDQEKISKNVREKIIFSMLLVSKNISKSGVNYSAKNSYNEFDEIYAKSNQKFLEKYISERDANDFQQYFLCKT